MISFDWVRVSSSFTSGLFKMFTFSRPYASVTAPSLVPALIPKARPIVGRVALLILGDKQGSIESILYSSNPKGQPECLRASVIHSHVNERTMRWMVDVYRILEEVTVVVPRMIDIVTNPPLEYFSVLC